MAWGRAHGPLRFLVKLALSICSQSRMPDNRITQLSKGAISYQERSEEKRGDWALVVFSGLAPVPGLSSRAAETLFLSSFRGPGPPSWSAQLTTPANTRVWILAHVSGESGSCWGSCSSLLPREFQHGRKANSTQTHLANGRM